MSRPKNGALLLICALSASLAWSDGGPNHQVRTLQFGSSGGNVNDASRAFCCGGTLGALLTDGTNQYILSNNHVVGRSGTAVAGEDITQPGLIDNGCRAADIVADFTLAPPLTSNVDAAIALLRTGFMDPNGSIVDIGVICSETAAPSINQVVLKSGRTTGFTMGTISSTNTTVSVQYQAGCGKGRKFRVTFTNQIVITPGTFSAGGDSGSLVVTDDVNKQPVGLLFAGSSSATIANPIVEVLGDLGAALGRPVSFVGGPCSPVSSGVIAPSAEQVTEARRALAERHDELLAHPSVLGVGVGAADDNASEAVIVVYIERGAAVPDLPDRVRNTRVKRVFTDPIVATGCCYKCQK